MRVSKSLSLFIVAASVFASVAYGQPKEGDLRRAEELVRAGQSAQALGLLDPIIAEAMGGEAKDPEAMCPGAAAAVLQSFIKADVTISVDNDFCEAMLLKGYALNELKRPAEAAEMLGRLVRHAPNNPQYLSEYAYTVRLNGNLPGAFDLYQKAEKAASKSPDRPYGARWRAVALRGQGYIHIERKNWNDATKAYRRSLKYDPSSQLARNELRFIEENRGR
jgi:tetratricopeptide (TPR) repeat protein